MVFSEEAKGRARKQIEFYFSDSNVPRDKFLREKIAENAEGFVDLALLCTFTRMTEALGISRKGKDAKVEVNPDIISQVAEVLRSSDSVTVSEDGKMVRRTKPIESPEEVTKKVDARSLFASPFPFDTTLDAVTAFFNTVAPVNCVRLRRHLVSTDFRGSVFVEFASQEKAAEVMGKPLVYEGAPLHLERKADFVNRKLEERGVKAAAKAANGATGDADASSESDDSDGEEEGTPEPAEPEKLEYEEGCLMLLDFGDASHELSYYEIKATFDDIAFVEFQKGASTGIVRFKKAAAVGPNLMLADDNDRVSVSGVPATARVLKGEEEKSFYIRAAAAQKRAAERGDYDSNRGHKRGRGRGGRGGRGGWGGRGKRGRR